MTKLIHPELSYKIMGIIFKAYNELGYGYQEKYYQRAIALELDEEKISYKKEKEIKLNYYGNNIGRYFLDFVIENKIVLELKVGQYFHSRDIKQILGYLKSTELQLGILAIITPQGIQYKRIINNNSQLYS